MDNLRIQLAADLQAAQNAEAVEEVRIKYLGRKGSITLLAKETDFSQLSADEKKTFGQRLNDLKQYATTALTEAAAAQAMRGTPKPRGVDLTLPATAQATTSGLGAMHPITLVQMELEQIFEGMGFIVTGGPECESDFYNFESLNIPADHPARDMQDTYWLTNGMLMRTHTSANQVRALQRFGAPLRAIFPGRCFRNEAVDPSHEQTFYQCEGLVVDENISVAHLIAVMRAVLQEVFKQTVKVRLRPGFFPFVEPGFELDLQCLLCGGNGCPTCRTGWIELIPCGLVHPRVLEAAAIDPKKQSGFAFGLGLTRLAMMKYAIRDIRYFCGGDVRFYEQFAAQM